MDKTELFRKKVYAKYDGEQHYRPVNFGGRSIDTSLKMFELTKIRDSIKTSYCKDNNINLLRLPYYLPKDEIKMILIKALKQSRSKAEASKPKLGSMI